MPHTRKRRSRRFYLLVGSAVAVPMAAGGIALAKWSTTASGNGSAKALTAQVFTITAAASPVADLFPGASGALQMTITNPNPYALSLTSVSYGTVVSSNPTNCPIANITMASGGTLGTPVAVAANAIAAPVTIASALTMSINAPDGCQGITFTVPITLTGSQA